ncbi:ABC transporter [Ceratobasidium sp. AG-Ba]|nr:ABC transporter [Ceratobasidium sp. AG-Ba]QRW11893.1 ABC transporter [Ceratobasidium sp. AG-Ba]
MLNVFWTQFRALTKKNLIVIRNHWLLNIIRFLLLPIVFALFFSYAFEIFTFPNNLGFGTPAPIAPLSETWTEGTIYYVDATNTSTSRVPEFISSFVTSANLSPAQQSRLKPLASRDEVGKACPGNFRLVSQCFAVLIFDYIPLSVNDIHALTYTMRIDAGRRMVNIPNHSSDTERVTLPLQWAVDKTGMEFMGLKGVQVPQEWPYTKQSNKEAQHYRRLSYVRTVESLMVLVFSLAFIIIVYQLSGSFVEECASGLSSLMHVMGCSSTARLLSWYFTMTFFHAPGWIATAVIWHFRVFTESNLLLLILLHIIYGFSITSFSLVACLPFRKSPQLAAIGTTFLTILFTIISLFIPITPSSAAISTLALPPSFYVFAIRAVSRFEKNQRPAQALLTRGEYDARILGWTIVVGSLNIFLWLLVAGLAEKWMLDPSAGNFRFMLRRLYRRMLPGRGPRVEFELLESDEPHMPIVTSKPYSTSSAITLDGLTKKFPAARWSAPEYTAVRDLTMAIPSRGIFVLLGANGSGKSTTLKMISGLEKQTSGKIEFGEDAYQVTEKGRLPTRKSKRSLGLVPQKDILFPELTCYQTLRFWHDIKLSHMPGSSNPFETAGESVKQLLDDCDLGAKMHASAATLSGGQKRRLQLAAGLVGGSKIVLVDEATSGVDPLSRRAIWKALGKAKHGRCIVFTTHFLDEADLLADEVAVLVAPGKLLAQGSPVSLKSKLGDGYAVHVTRTPDAPASFDESVLSAIRRHAPLASLDCNERDTYLLHSKDAETVGFVLDELEETKGKLGLASYDVKGTTLEGVFLKLLNSEEEHEKPSPRTELELKPYDSAVSIHSDATEETLIGRDSSVGIGKKLDTLALSDGRKTSPFRQALTGFHKRLLIFRRSWFACALMIGVGIAGSCGPLMFMKNRVNTCALDDRTEQMVPLYLPGARFVPGSWITDNVPETWYPVIAPPDLLQVLGSSDLPQKKVPDSAAFNQAIQQMYTNLSLGGLEVYNGQATFAWEASPGSFGGSALLNLASNVLLGSAFGQNGTGPQIFASYQGLPGTRMANIGMAAKWEGFFSATMGVWPAFLALYVSAERRSSVQAMQLSNGMTPAGLWMGHLLFDLPWITLIVTVVVVILGTVSNQFYALAALWVVLELYGVAGALVAYLVSTFAKSPIVAFAIAGGYNALMSLLYGSAYILAMTYTQPAHSESALQVVRYEPGVFSDYTLSLLSPIVSVVRAAILSVNLFSILCDGLGNFSSTSPFSMSKFGGPIVYLVGWIIFLFSLLLWLEYGKPVPSWLRRKDNTEAFHSDLEGLVAHTGMFGAEVRAEAERVHRSHDALRVLDVSKKFPGGFTAVNDLSFGVHNETFALLGPNGAGKTTTFNMIRGDIRPSRGDIEVCGKSIVHDQADARLGLGVTPQFTAADSQLTVKEHLMIYGSLKGLHGKELKRNVDLLMEATALTRYADRFATKLSGGNGRKLSLALSLIGNPRVLLIDEYSTGVDAATKRAMWKTLQRVSHGKAVIITTHSMEEAAALSSRIGIFAKRMLAIGTLDALASRFSTYEVHFAARTPQETIRARILMSRLPGARQAEDLATRYEVPIGQTSLAELFKTLSNQQVGDDESDDGTRLEYTVERIGLESVFLKVIQERDDDVKSSSTSISRPRYSWRF